ncbi:MAG: hypothetical protein MJ211_11220 [Bacteroidales bacterium]|nr:hypothetical protein [Bacteroidales bacterium]
MQKYFLSILLFFVLFDNIKAQDSTYFDEYSFLYFNKDTSQKLSLNLYEHNFFKNNEYFGDFVKGYTLIGFNFQPELTYRPFNKWETSVIWNVIKYHGYDNFSEYKPYFRIRFNPNNKFNVSLGYLDANVSHQLIEPIYNPERYITNNVENGLQVKYNSPKYYGDLWLNWEKFILWNDPWQERLAVGHISKVRFFNFNNFNGYITGQFLICHRGGQIDDSDGQVQTLENGALGFEFHHNTINNNWKFVMKNLFVQYHAIDETADLPYLDGFGIYNKLLMNYKDFGFVCGHWYGNMFMNFRGDPLFTCQAIYKENNKNERAVLFNELYYSKHFNKIFSLKIGVNTFYNLYNGDLEYFYMFSMIFNPQFNFLSNK